MEQRITMVTLGVADLDRARAFYAALGWTAAAHLEATSFYQAGGMVVGLYGRAALAEEAGIADAGATFSGIAVAHNVRRREEVDEILDEAVAAGGTLVKAAEDVFWGGYSGYFADPDGHLWEVAWNPHWTLAGDGSVRLSG